MMNLDDALQTYIVESRELLEEMEGILLQIEQEDDKDESLNAIFRAAHTIKGSAGLFGLDYIVSFTHGVESLLDQLREGEMAMPPELVALLLACGDHLSDLVELAYSGAESLDETLTLKGDELSKQLNNFGIATDHNETPAASSFPEVTDIVLDRVEGYKVENVNWHISLRFGVNSFREGMEPLSFLRYLATLGEIINVITLDDALPDAEKMDPESCYLGFEINFKTKVNKQTIENVFEFIREDSVVRILAPKSLLNDYLKLIEELPEEELKLGEILVLCGSLTQAECNKALNIQSTHSDRQKPRKAFGDIVVENGMSSQQVLDAAADKQMQVREAKSRESQSVRVDAEKLDELINLIGELVIASAGSALIAQAGEDSVLTESISLLAGLVGEVRDSTLRMRMVQIGATFNRFKRVVRDVSAELNKEINLVITGAETELDKTVIEKIGDPLMHLVRNAIDHGIEPAEVRLTNNKTSTGTLQLNAYHDSGSVVIEVIDDGAGLNRDRILQKAKAKGLVAKDAELDDSEIYNLIFAPGFSTTDSVTSLSGRGVGMDVVKRNVTALRGTVDVYSQSGEGTTFRVRMPLTLAIIDGFLVGVEQSSFVIPLDTVLECVELEEIDKKISADRNYINLKGEVLPFIRVREMFSLGGMAPRRENVVVVQAGDTKVGLVVDRLMGEFQTVIKPLGNIFNHVVGVGGATILGNGEVALIFDVRGLLKTVS
jgi:two-component system chemotaxis sensor kinase CheA